MEQISFEELLCPEAVNDWTPPHNIFCIDITNPATKPGGQAKRPRFRVITKNKEILLLLLSFSPDHQYGVFFKLLLRLEEKETGEPKIAVIRNNRTNTQTIASIIGDSDLVTVHLS